MANLLKVPLLLHPQPEGGYLVTSPLIPELVTEADTIEDVLANVQDALEAVIELYEDLGRHLPQSLRQPVDREPIWFEALVPTS